MKDELFEKIMEELLHNIEEIVKKDKISPEETTRIDIKDLSIKKDFKIWRFNISSIDSTLKYFSVDILNWSGYYKKCFEHRSPSLKKSMLSVVNEIKTFWESNRIVE